MPAAYVTAQNRNAKIPQSWRGPSMSSLLQIRPTPSSNGLSPASRLRRESISAPCRRAMLLVWLLSAVSVQAQHRFERWDTHNGLPQNDGRFTRYTTVHGLFDDGVFQISACAGTRSRTARRGDCAGGGCRTGRRALHQLGPVVAADLAARTGQRAGLEATRSR